MGIDIDIEENEDKDTRNIYISENITQSSVNDAIQSIIEFNQEDAKGEAEKVKYKRETINVYVSSFGGEVYSGLGLVDVIRSSKTQVNTYCTGKAMSMGLIIYLVGHKKYMYQNSTLMYHSVASCSWGKIQEMEEDLDESKRLQKLLDNIVASTTKIKRSVMKKVVKDKRDWFISAEEAVALGACDGVY